MLFQDISVMGLVGVVTFIVLHALITRTKRIQGAQAPTDTARWAVTLRPLRWLAGWLTVLAVAFLTLTGWCAVWRGQALTGYLLMAHVTGGGVFAVAFAVWVVLTAGRYPLVEASPRPCLLGQQKRLCFWILVVLALPVILSIVLNFCPFFAMEDQACVDACHRYSALGFVLVGVLFAYFAIRTERLSTSGLQK